jgi:hypothetical protein
MKTKRLFLFGLSALLLALGLVLASCDPGGYIKVHNTTSNRYFYVTVISDSSARIGPNQTESFHVNADGTWDVEYYEANPSNNSPKEGSETKTKSVYVSGSKTETVDIP